MHSSSLLALPPTILLLLCAPLQSLRPVVVSAAELQWPHNLPKHLKYFPEEEAHVKRGLSVQERLQRGDKPVGVRKMSSSDEGEMFFLDNWVFSDTMKGRRNIQQEEEKAARVSVSDANATCRVNAPIRPHSHQRAALFPDSFLPWRARTALQKRDFQCPEGTDDCSDIGAPNSCCYGGSSCMSIEDTGYGSVGCCPEGDSCAGEISCDTESGYSDCPGSENGGCCMPGYSCEGVGCIVAGTSITYIQPSTSARPTPSSTSTAVVVVPTSPSTSPSPTPTPTPSTCSTGWFSCAASLGGGCCQSGRTCATGVSCVGSNDDSSSSPAPTSNSGSITPSAPVRPTSNSPGGGGGGGGSNTDLCPAGFYVCSAYYPSGCCRVGRDCQTTGSCIEAETPSATLLATNGVTVVGPAGERGGGCPSAWYSCAADNGGDCCPEGFACGESECTATETGMSGQTSVAEKLAPSGAATAVIVSDKVVWSLLLGAVGIGIGMITL